MCVWGGGALKAVAAVLPSCAPRPVTKHRIRHFVYVSQSSAYEKREKERRKKIKGLAATRLSGRLLEALKTTETVR